MKIVVPMSGEGRRFVEAGFTTPKPFIEVDGKSMVEHVAALFSGEDRLLFIYNVDHSSASKKLRSKFPSCEMVASKTVVEGKKGPVVAVLQAVDRIDDEEEVIISYCDYGTEWDYHAFLDHARRNQLDGVIAAYRGFHPHMLGKDNYAFLLLDDDGHVARVQEKKPFTNNRMQEYASNGTYYFRKGSILKQYFSLLIERDIQVGGEYYVSMVYNLMVEDGLRVGVFEIQKMLQWGTPQDMENYNRWSLFFREFHPKLVSKKDGDDDHHGVVLILPMAGKGSRFVMDGFTDPKPALEVDGLPMVVRAVEQLPATDRKIFLCLRSNPDMSGVLHNHFDGCQVLYVEQVTEGQACSCEFAIANASPPIQDDEPVLIAPCDNGMVYDHDMYRNMMRDDQTDVIVWTFSNEMTSKNNPEMYAWVDADNDGHIRHVSVKKPLEGKESKYAMTGTVLFKKAKYFRDSMREMYEQDIRVNGEYYVDSMINLMVRKNLQCRILNVDYYLCWGTPNDYKTYQYWAEYFAKFKK